MPRPPQVIDGLTFCDPADAHRYYVGQTTYLDRPRPWYERLWRWLRRRKNFNRLVVVGIDRQRGIITVEARK
ncbi:MAG TPA: hypothetical protein VFH73_23240 [Polyangia bacterium]|jgi:hypothetical protein|nr:hypothetical protein [Polyangia bacterium]